MVALKTLDLSVLDLEPPAETQNEIKLVAFMRAHGAGTDEIADKLSIPAERVEVLSKSPKLVEEMLRIQRTLNFTPQARIQSTLGLALDAKVKILMTSADDKLKNLVATDLLDRGMGKAVQTILNHNTNVTAETIEAVDDNMKQLHERLALLEGQRTKLRDSAIPVAPA